eukprot:Filipodium_phascolosomae@DN2772_c0_g1_i15.p1
MCGIELRLEQWLDVDSPIEVHQLSHPRPSDSSIAKAIPLAHTQTTTRVDAPACRIRDWLWQMRNTFQLQLSAIHQSQKECLRHVSSRGCTIFGRCFFGECFRIQVKGVGHVSTLVRTR